MRSHCRTFGKCLQIIRRRSSPGDKPPLGGEKRAQPLYIHALVTARARDTGGFQSALTLTSTNTSCSSTADVRDATGHTSLWPRPASRGPGPPAAGRGPGVRAAQSARRPLRGAGGPVAPAAPRALGNPVSAVAPTSGAQKEAGGDRGQHVGGTRHSRRLAEETRVWT